MMNNRELWILIASYTCLCLVVILITGKWW
nr:MAG TPA: NICKEL-COBALT-CADMIUM RESISTANCE PROTEIN NCCX BINDING PROTEIN, MEMBRANE PROTEIN [Caudoviricetes sp.]